MAQTPQPKPTKPIALTGVSVLVVDDDQDIRELVAEALKLLGATVFEAADGIDALEIAAKEALDIIVSDVRMPRCDGIELLRKIRATHNRSLGFIVMTGYHDIPTGEVMSLGGNEVLFKPFEVADVVHSIQGCLKAMRRVS